VTKRGVPIDRRRFLAATGLGAALLVGRGKPVWAVARVRGDQLAIGFAAVSNCVGPERFTAELTLTNHAPLALPRAGWAIYFNVAAVLQTEPGAGLAVEHVDGDLSRLMPTAEFRPLGPGETRRIGLVSDNPTIADTDAPLGFYLVHDPEDRNAVAEPIGEPAIAPFIRPEQLARSADDPLPSQTPALTYEQNAGLSLLPEAELGHITPEPVEAVYPPGHLAITGAPRIRHAAALAGEAQFLTAALAGLTAGRPRPCTAHIDLALDPALVLPGIAEQGYRLTIDADGIRIAGRTAQGVFHGIQSLLQLLPIAAWRKPQPSLTLPFCRIADAPAFAYRGQHFDVARNFSDKHLVLRLLDLLALYKMNALHLHLTDDEGWRLEMPSLPELTAYGAERGFSPGEAACLQPAFGSGAERHRAPGSGYFSQRDFVEILRYAKTRHIEVIPELDLPGHARAAIKAMAARHDRLAAAGRQAEAEAHLLHDPDDRSHYQSVQLWHDNVICIGRDSCYRFVETVLGDLQHTYRQAGLTLTTLHIGGDEVPEGVWEESPSCRRFMAEQGLATISDLQAYFFTRLGRILAGRGIAMGGWEQAALAKADGKTRLVPPAQRPGLTAYVWSNGWESERPDIAERLANAGYPVILCNAGELYLDLAYEKAPAEPGAYWAGFTNLRKVFDFLALGRFDHPAQNAAGQAVDPTGRRDLSRLTPSGTQNLRGIQGELWGETLRSPERVEYLLMPRLIAVAERGWTPAPAMGLGPEAWQQARNAAWNGFANRLGQRELPRLDGFLGGVGYRVPVPGLVLKDGAAHANLDTPGLVLRYTLDGSDPSVTAATYSQPVPLAASQILKLAAFTTTGRSGRVVTLPGPAA
jgi:hexosaminidase